LGVETRFGARRDVVQALVQVVAKLGDLGADAGSTFIFENNQFLPFSTGVSES
jgi:hypothetical protein